MCVVRPNLYSREYGVSDGTIGQDVPRSSAQCGQGLSSREDGQEDHGADAERRLAQEVSLGAGVLLFVRGFLASFVLVYFL